MLKTVATAMIASLMLIACTSSPSRADVDWQHGAKRAWIAGFYTPDMAAEEMPACLARLSKQDWAGRRFVQLRYRHVRLTHSTVAELPAGMQAGIDDRVEVWPEDCARGRIARISRLLPRDDE